MKVENLKKYYGQAQVSLIGLNKQIADSFDSVGAKLAKIGVPANVVSIVGFVIGLLAINFISLQMYAIGLLFILLNRLCDGLDGAIARKAGVTDFGVFLDAVLDYVFYAGVIFAFALADSQQNAVAAAFLLFAFASSACAMLAYAIIAYKNNGKQDFLNNSPFYLCGVAQGSETLVALFLMCMIPGWFMPLAIVFGVLGLVKTLMVAAAAYYNFVIETQKSKKMDK